MVRRSRDLENVGNIRCLGWDEVPAVTVKGDRDVRLPLCGCDADGNRVIDYCNGGGVCCLVSGDAMRPGSCELRDGGGGDWTWCSLSWMWT